MMVHAVRAAIVALVLGGCDSPTLQVNACDASGVTLSLSVVSTSVAVTSTTTYTSPADDPDAGLEDGASSSTSVAVPTPTPILVELQLTATSSCVVEGAPNANLVASNGTFVAPVATAAPMATVPLSLNSGGSLSGGATLQLSTDTTVYVRAFLGDSSRCWSVITPSLSDGDALSEAGLPTVGDASLGACPM